MENHISEGREIFARLDEVTGGRSALMFIDVTESTAAYQAVQPRLQAFFSDLEVLSNIDGERLLHARSYAERVDLAVAPTGIICRGIDAMIDDVKRDAASLASNLRLIRTAIFAVMVAVILALASFLIFPALKDLAWALKRERHLRVHMAQMARHDRMTGLLNRAGLEEALSKFDPAKPYACAIIDLNMFKPINDAFGHAAGDAVLVEIATRMKVLLGSHVLTARIGGDEFAVIEPGISLAGCETLGTTLVGIFDDPIRYGDHQFRVGAAIGVAQSSQTEPGFDAVLTAADAAMYRLKGTGKTDYNIFSQELSATVHSLERKESLENALRAREFRPWYQPKFDLQTGDLTGFEALCRWHHPDQGILAPVSFLEDVDRYDLQLELSVLMFTAVLDQLRTWTRSGFDPPQVAVNVSAETLASESGIEAVMWRLAEYGDVKHLIIMEITEDVFLPRIATAVNRSIDLIADIGVRISIDDFGSGYASFRHLNEFTFHELKIDSSFVQGIGKDRSAEVFLTAFMSVARGIGVEVVAEGIETDEQQRFLVQLGCQHGQGFLFSPAVPYDEAVDWLRQQKAKDLGQFSA
ncbi:MAG: bifunctional diguanylate cyclase/phosphodiesterase [Pseudomonadota bacterium]